MQWGDSRIALLLIWLVASKMLGGDGCSRASAQPSPLLVPWRQDWLSPLCCSFLSRLPLTPLPSRLGDLCLPWLLPHHTVVYQVSKWLPHTLYITNIIAIFSKFICCQYVNWFSYQLNVNFGPVSRLRCCWSVSQVNHSHSVISCRHWANNDVFYSASMEF